jgi:DNA helicase INO80
MTNPRDINVKTKKYLKELLLYQRKVEKDERESKKKSEKELQDKRKKESEIRETQRQENKISFLLSQTELFSHFLAKKLTKNSAFVPENIHDRESVERTTAAVEKHHQQIQNFEHSIQGIRASKPYTTISIGEPQVPAIFKGQLKSYQVEGFRWLVNLYEQGINGILADESKNFMRISIY